MDKILVTLQLLLLFSGVNCYPSGAPNSACTSLMPSHSGAEAQPSQTSPYSITTSVSEYTAGSTVTVTLSGTQSFKGFLLVATNSSTGDLTKTVGTLEGTSANAQIKNICDGNTAVTHTQRLTTDNLQIKWTAPAELVGNIYFYASFVEKVDTFWVKLSAPPVLDGVTELPGPTTPAPTEGVIGDLAQDIAMDGCDDGSKGCWKDCNENNECDYLVTYVQDSSDSNRYLFEVFASNVNGYVALGLAPGLTMNDVSIVACIADSNAGVQQFYAEGQAQPSPVTTGPLSSGNAKFRYDIGKKTMSCSFTYDNTVAKGMLGQWKDLSQGKHRMLLARGNQQAGQIFQHTASPAKSPEVDFTKIESLSGGVSSPLVKAHGALMILAWVLCASIGIIMARFYKPMWVEKKACGQKIWFQIHRAVMLAAMFISLIAFVLILVHKRGLYTLPAQLPWRAHPVLGLIAIICSLLNPLIAAFRCHPGDKKRPIFNWLHWFFGTVAHVFAIVAIFIGMMFSSAEVPYWLVYVMMAYCIVHFLVELILEIQNCCMYDKNRDRKEEFELSGKGPGDTGEPHFAGRSFRCAMLVIYMILVPILALVMVFVVAFVRA